MNKNLEHTAVSTVFLLVLFITSIASAQKAGKQTVVLNDGTWVTGTIISDSGNYLRIKVTSPQIVSIRKSEVFKWDPDLTARNRLKSRQDFNTNDINGYRIRVSASVLSGKNERGSTGTMSFHFSNGFRFRNGLEAGIGAGIEEFETVNLPVYADIRFHPLKTRISPFAWIRSGIGIPINNNGEYENYYYGYYTDAKPGPMFNTGAGIALFSGKNCGVNVGIGYRYQKLTFREVNSWRQGSTNDIITHFNRIELQFGFILH